MAIGVTIIAALVFIGWLIIRGVKVKSVKAHFFSYGVAVISGVFTYAYFLSLDFPELIKIVVSIVLGIILIVVAALLQRRVAARPDKSPR
jgi:phosphatidylserine synthase